MLNYEEFKKEVRNGLISAMGEKFSDYRIREMPVNKSGRVKDGFGVYRKKSKKSVSVMPTLYYDDLYKNYLAYGSVENEINKAAASMVEGLKQGKNISRMVRTDRKPETVVFQLVNRKEFGSLLKDVPHRDFLDLAIIYRWAINIDSEGFSSSIIDNSMARHFGLTEEELFTRALDTTRTYFPPEIHSVDELMLELITRDGTPREEARQQIDSVFSRGKMFFVSNRCRKIGASVLLFSDILGMVSEQVNSDLYILPVSASEIIVVASDIEQDIQDVFNLFLHSNEIFEDEDDFLSDNIYYFNRLTGGISCYENVR